MTSIRTPLLDKRSDLVVKRLIQHFGSEQHAEAWLDTPNSYLHGEKPAEHFEHQGEGWFLDATCMWPLEDTRRLRTQFGVGLELDIPESADWTREQSLIDEGRRVRAEQDRP